MGFRFSPPCALPHYGPIGPYIVGDFGWSGPLLPPGLQHGYHHNFDQDDFFWWGDNRGHGCDSNHGQGLIGPYIVGDFGWNGYLFPPGLQGDGGCNNHHDQEHLPPTQLNATLDPSATDGHGHSLSGSGIPDFGWQTQDAGHNELAMYMGYRTGNFIQPGAVEHDGTLDFTGRAGTQIVDMAHSVSTANANRGAVAEGWSFDTGANGGGMTQQQFLASGNHEQVKIDLDPSAGFKFLTLDAKYDPVHNPGGSHVVWTAHDNTFAAQGIHQGDVIVADDGGNAYTTQNTTNLAFFNGLIDHNPHTPGIQGGPVAPAGHYEFDLSMTDAHNHTIASIHSDLHLV